MTDDKPVYLGPVPTDIEAIKPGEVWTGPVGGDPFAAFGPGTTKGGRAKPAGLTWDISSATASRSRQKDAR